MGDETVFKCNLHSSFNKDNVTLQYFIETFSFSTQQLESFIENKYIKKSRIFLNI